MRESVCECVHGRKVSCVCVLQVYQTQSHCRTVPQEYRREVGRKQSEREGGKRHEKEKRRKKMNDGVEVERKRKTGGQAGRWER